nr:hypothetical protein BaRGS_013689 [Batillaria attramentaria]
MDSVGEEFKVDGQREVTRPEARQHLGSLEKKKDYKERAREYQKKRDTIKALKKKADNKNPDEFYFNMVSTQKVDGVHQKRKEKEETTTEAQELLMQREDFRYVQWKRTVELRKIEKLKGRLQLLDPEFHQNKHIVFVDKETEVGEAKQRLLEEKKQLMQKTQPTPETQEEMEQVYGMLAKRYERLKELTVIAQKLETSMQLTKDKTGKKKLVAEETKESAAVYRWVSKRKR